MARLDTTTGSPAEIKSKLASASAGDTITLPPGQITWSTPLNISALETKAVTIEGAGPQTGGTTVLMSAPGVVFTWVIKAGTPLSVNPAADPAISRLKGIFFKQDPNLPTRQTQFLFTAAGNNLDNSRFHWTDCKIDRIGEIFIVDWIGLIDHCDFISKTGATPSSGSGPILRPFHSKWNGGTYAHKSWSDAINWSSDEFIYVEDCSFYADGNSTGAVGRNGSSTGFGPTGGVGSNNTSAIGPVPPATGVFAGLTDATSGARIIVRNCQTFRAAFNTHGTDTGNQPQGARGCVAYGKFNNAMYSMHDGRGSCRSGIELAYGNREYTLNGRPLSGSGFPNQSYRSAWWTQFPYKSLADGRDGGEQKGPYTYDHNDGVVYRSGTATSVPTAVAGSVKRVFVSQAMTAGQYAEAPSNTSAFVLVNTSTSFPHVAISPPQGSTARDWSACIIGNGVDYIDFFAGASFMDTPLTFAINDPYEIRGVISALDGPGMHGVPGSTFLSGNILGENGTPPFACNNVNDQVVLGNYYWDNFCVKMDGTSPLALPAGNQQLTTSRIGRHIFNSQPSPTYFLPYDYPHALNPNAGPVFDITGVTGFTAGATATCTAPEVNCCKIGTRNFTAGDAGSISLISWTPAVSNINFAYLGSGDATISGSASGMTSGNYTALIRGTNPTTDKSITINVSAPNDPPSVPVITSPGTGGSYPVSTPIVISVDSTDPENQMDKIEFYSDSVLIGSSSVGSPYQFTWGQGSSPVPLTNGGHTLSAKAYDNVGNVTSSTISVNITVTTVAPPPSPALVVVIN